mgnify:CR=1 FL=1
MKISPKALSHPAVKALHLKSTTKELDAALRTTGLFDTYHYVKDYHFEGYILDRFLVTYKQAKAFMNTLNAERAIMETGYKCQKAQSAECWFKNPQWRMNGNVATVFAKVRRTHCTCHEVGDFSTNERYEKKLEATKLAAHKKAMARIDALTKNSI